VSESRIARQIRQDRQQQESLKNLALINSLERGGNDPEQDRVIAIVRDAYWIQVYWEVACRLIKSSIKKAKIKSADIAGIAVSSAYPSLVLIDNSSFPHFSSPIIGHVK